MSYPSSILREMSLNAFWDGTPSSLSSILSFAAALPKVFRAHGRSLDLD